MHPYKGLPKSNFWRPSIADKIFFDYDNLWQPKFEVSNQDVFATYGSCFAQNFSNA